MTRILTTAVLMALASGCADTPLVPTPESGAPQTTDRPSNVIRTLEMVLSNEDPPVSLGEIPYYFDPPYPRACAPCGVVSVGEPVPRTIVLTWTGDFTLYAWMEGDSPRDGTPLVVAEYSVGDRYGAKVGRQMRIQDESLALANKRLKVGFPLTGGRVTLDAPQHITVTMWD